MRPPMAAFLDPLLEYRPEMVVAWIPLITSLVFMACLESGLLAREQRKLRGWFVKHIVEGHIRNLFFVFDVLLEMFVFVLIAFVPGAAIWLLFCASGLINAIGWTACCYLDPAKSTRCLLLLT